MLINYINFIYPPLHLFTSKTPILDVKRCKKVEPKINIFNLTTCNIHITLKIQQIRI